MMAETEIISWSFYYQESVIDDGTVGSFAVSVSRT